MSAVPEAHGICSNDMTPPGIQPHGMGPTCIQAKESVQHRAARWIKNNYSTLSSVGKMLIELELESLEKRRNIQRITHHVQDHPQGHGASPLLSNLRPYRSGTTYRPAWQGRSILISSRARSLRLQLGTPHPRNTPTEVCGLSRRTIMLYAYARAMGHSSQAVISKIMVKLIYLN